MNANLPLVESNQRNQMETDCVISIRNLSKVYHIFSRPIDRLKFSLFWRFGKTYGKEFWALKNIAFDVFRGDALGIVGLNGSGKSTLLQIIAGVLQPTTGEVMVKGRVSALLELGSGFNWEYTGRQNVYMNGAILGFSKEDMDNRFDDIAAFADIGEFIDQPVKLYSSGMFARLAFSVAVAVEPDILIVDEILSVGDFAFQQKCIGHMRKMLDDGLTLLYVSHSTDSVKGVCNKGIFLHEGQIKVFGNSETATDQYLKFIRENKWREVAEDFEKRTGETREIPDVSSKLRYGTGQARITSVYLTDDSDQKNNVFMLGDTIKLHMIFVVNENLNCFSANFHLRDSSGIGIMGTNLFDERYEVPDLKKGDRGHIVFRFKNQLRHGNYGVVVSLNTVSDRNYSDNVELDWIGNAISFQILHNPERPVWYKFHSPVEIEFDLLSSNEE